MVVNQTKLDLISSFAAQQLEKKINENSKSLTNLPPWLYPFATENQYKSSLSKMVSSWIESAREIIIPQLPSLVNEANLLLPPEATNIKTDDYAEDIDVLMNLYTTQIKDINDDIKASIFIAANSTNLFNEKQWLKITESALGVPIFNQELWLPAATDSFISENVKLITKLSEDVRNDIETIINRGIRQGKRHETIAKEILNGTNLQKGVFRKARTRAKLIARDQVEKWNGQLTMLRQTNAGVTEYEWMTAADERVRGRPGGKFANARPSHWKLEGKICKWSDPTVYKNNIDDKKWLKRSSIGAVEEHVGQPIN